MVEYIDGVKVFVSEDGKYAEFNDWLIENGYQSKDEMYSSLISNEIPEEDIEESISKLEGEFLDWCSDNDINGET